MKYGYIYKIHNIINGKEYVGQTKDTVEMRWRKHIDNAKNNPYKQVITQAIAKYGEENFLIEEIAKCPVEDLDKWEIFYIKKYDTFQNGYNMTLGGNGSYNKVKPELVEQIIWEALNSETNYTLIAKKLGVSDKTVAKILKLSNIKIKRRVANRNIENLRQNWGRHNENLIVNLCPVKIEELDKEFNSMLECARFLIDNNYTKTDNEFYVLKSISRATSNKDYGRNTYLGFHINKI